MEAIRARIQNVVFFNQWATNRFFSEEFIIVKIEGNKVTIPYLGLAFKDFVLGRCAEAIEDRISWVDLRTFRVELYLNLESNGPDEAPYYVIEGRRSAFRVRGLDLEITIEEGYSDVTVNGVSKYELGTQDWVGVVKRAECRWIDRLIDVKDSERNNND